MLRRIERTTISKILIDLGTKNERLSFNMVRFPYKPIATTLDRK